MAEANEPTNIKWENWDKTPSMQTKRKIAVGLAIAVLLLGAFASFYLLKSQTISNYRKYPPTTDCDSIVNLFEGNFDDSTFIKYAQTDQANTESEKGTGLYQCFCQKNPNSNDICSDFTYDKYKALALSQVVTFGIVAVNFIIRTINIILIKTIGYYTESKEAKVIMISIFIA